MEAYNELHENPSEELLGSGKVRRFLFVQTATYRLKVGVFQENVPNVKSEEDALEWRYYGCKIKHVSGLKLNRCLEKVGPVKFAGESTLDTYTRRFCNI